MGSSLPLRIVVTGFVATYPFGGVFWDYIQYLLGFQQMGHDVLYVEDTGRWCYDPIDLTFVEDGTHNATHLNEQLRRLGCGLEDRWFYRDAADRTFGMSWKEAAEFCRSADLFLNISASCWMREEYFAAGRSIFVDSDPMYTQASIPGYVSGDLDDEARCRVDMLREHDVFFTFAENIGAPDCLVPTALFDWIPTRQPVVLDCFRPYEVPFEKRERVLTTVASWEPTEGGPTIEGVEYSGKSTEFRRFIDLPRRSPVPLELAMSGNPPREELRQHGWQIRNAYEVSRDPWGYRDYLASSFGEWSVAKNAYVASRSGWFSCRSACYLALGVPAVVQQTGFASDIPTNCGVLAFESLDEAAGCIESLSADPVRHARQAVEIARECFDARRVLTELIDQAGSTAAAKTTEGVAP